MSLIRSFRYALAGIYKAMAKERNLKVQLVASVLICAAGVYFRISNTEWLAVIICIGMVICLELMNTAIEETVNFISPEFHEKAGLIKDISAGAVLVAAVISLIVSGIIFLPKFIS
jgi:diacylglycerol kinase